MDPLFKFACIYCGQHMKCRYGFRGRRIQCPTCQHKIVIPLTEARQALKSASAWEASVRKPLIETPTGYCDLDLKCGVGADVSNQ
ncbi:MAG TPA: hypothetical protein DCE44_14075 [Verrucomicrobiales bacterium]|nr:hypothetical protein [Verrucomicrobiales bacterium]